MSDTNFNPNNFQKPESGSSNNQPHNLRQSGNQPPVFQPLVIPTEHITGPPTHTLPSHQNFSAPFNDLPHQNFRPPNNGMGPRNFRAPFEDMSQQNVGRYTNTGRGRGNFRGRNNDGSHQKFGLANHGPQFFTSSPNNHSQPNYGGLDSSAQPVFLGSPSNNSRTPYQNGYFRGSYERGRPSNRRGFQHTEPNQRKRIYPSEDSNPARGSERGRSSNMRNPGRSFRINRRNETNNAWASQLNELATGESQTQQHERVDVSMYIQEAIFQNPWEPLEKSKGLV